MSAKPFIFPIKVLPDDIDFMGHVNNARYLNWVQEAVLAHWRKLAPAEEIASKAWVALKHEITYRKPANREFAAPNRGGPKCFVPALGCSGQSRIRQQAGMAPLALWEGLRPMRRGQQPMRHL